MMIRLITILCFLFSLTSLLSAQSPECGTLVEAADEEGLRKLNQRLSQTTLANRSADTMRFIPVQLHIIRPSNGVGGISAVDYLAALDYLNNIYKEAGMHFFECAAINYIDSDQYYDFDKADKDALDAAHSVSQVINIYSANSVVSGGNAICGFSNFPIAGSLDIVVMQNSCTMNGSTWAHELGHYFGLFHTHEVYNGAEAVDGSDCATEGDLICDTPADPGMTTTTVDVLCIYSDVATVDENMELYNPATDNIMSYARSECRETLTPGQFDRMIGVLNNERAYLNCGNTLALDSEFYYDYDPNCTNNLTVNFCDATEAGATSWAWDFGDGNISNQQFPTHNYTTPGSYSVALTTTDASGSDVETKNNIVRIGSATLPYIQDFETGATALLDFNETTTMKNSLEVATAAAKDGSFGFLMEGFPSSSSPFYYPFGVSWAFHEDANKFYQSRIEICIDAVGHTDLRLLFDMKQLFGFNAKYTNFRILADENQIGTTYQADGTETWEKIVVNLDDYANTVFTLAFEGSNKYDKDYGINGNATYIDNIVLKSSTNDFVTTWRTDTTGVSNNNQITIPATGNYEVYWEEIDSVTNNGTVSATGNQTITFPNPGNYKIAISGDIDSLGFDNTGDHLKLLTIENWGNISWTDLTASFSGCANMTYNATDAPDLTAVQSISQMFKGCTLFNGDVGNWDVSTIKSMSRLFKNAPNFNQYLGLWSTGEVTNMRGMFAGATAFNQDILFWNTSKVTNMAAMFEGATSFDQPVGYLDFSQVTDLSKILDNSGLSESNYDATLSGWDNQTLQPNVTCGTLGLTYCAGRVSRNRLTNEEGWIISGDTLKTGCNFQTLWKTDNPGSSANSQITLPIIGNYDIYWEEDGNPANNGVMSASGTYTLHLPTVGTYRLFINGNFYQIKFNDAGDRRKLIDIEQWGNTTWINMTNAFSGCENLNCSATDAPDLTYNQSCNFMFKNCFNFNAPINHWDVSTITSMQGMFQNTTSFSQNLSNWNVSNVKNMRFLFSGSAFNGNISNWNTNEVTNMGSMFEENKVFNQDISGWNIGKVKFMGFMFKNAHAFNQNIGSWNTQSVTKMASAFENAKSFNQNLSNWNMSNANNVENMLDSCILSEVNYDSTLIGWAAQNVQPNLILGANGLTYCSGQNARNTLIGKGWNFINDNYQCSSLPIELNFFNAQLINNQVELSWQTSAEINNNYFEIQRSYDGDRWQTIGLKEGIGSTQNISNYKYTDQSPLLGYSYYRLKQIDFDGTFSFTDVQTIYYENDNSRALQLYPNPTSDFLTVIHEQHTEGNSEYYIYNSQGQLIERNLKILDSTSTLKRIDVRNLESGVYFLGSSDRNFARFVIQKQ